MGARVERHPGTHDHATATTISYVCARDEVTQSSASPRGSPHTVLARPDHDHRALLMLRAHAHHVGPLAFQHLAVVSVAVLPRYPWRSAAQPSHRHRSRKAVKRLRGYNTEPAWEAPWCWTTGIVVSLNALAASQLDSYPS